ncbi:MAG: hypothetical protein ACM3ZB_16825 [bacterium]
MLSNSELTHMPVRGFGTVCSVLALVLVLAGISACGMNMPGGWMQSSGVVAESRRIASGKVKTYTPGREITIDVAMGFDKSYDLSQPEPGTRITVSPKIKVGDTVAVIEYDENSVRNIDIVLQEDLAEGFVVSTRANGRVIGYTPGERITVRIDGNGTRTYDLSGADGVYVAIGAGVREGDAVTVLEGSRQRQRVIRIEKTGK